MFPLLVKGGVRGGLVYDPPFEGDVFGKGRDKAGGERVCRFGEKLEALIFATGKNGQINLGGGFELRIRNGNLFLTRGEGGGA